MFFPSTSKNMMKPKQKRKFELKMELSNLIQIPCHHVLTNEIDLNLKYRIGLKQFFNLNFGIGTIKINLLEYGTV